MTSETPSIPRPAADYVIVPIVENPREEFHQRFGNASQRKQATGILSVAAQMANAPIEDVTLDVNCGLYFLNLPRLETPTRIVIDQCGDGHLTQNEFSDLITTARAEEQAHLIQAATERPDKVRSDLFVANGDEGTAIDYEAATRLVITTRELHDVPAKKLGRTGNGDPDIDSDDQYPDVWVISLC